MTILKKLNHCKAMDDIFATQYSLIVCIIDNVNNTQNHY